MNEREKKTLSKSQKLAIIFSFSYHCDLSETTTAEQAADLKETEDTRKFLSQYGAHGEEIYNDESKNLLQFFKMTTFTFSCNSIN